MLELALAHSSPFGVKNAIAVRQVHRTRLSLQKLAEIDARLATVYADWSARRPAGLLPTWSGADVQDLRPSVDRLQVVEALEVRPTAGRFQSVIDVLGESHHYEEFSGFMNLSLECPTVDPIVRGLIEDYTNVTFFGSPALHRVVAETDNATRGFNRLILPLAADGRRVSLLMVCLNAAQA